MNKNDQIIKCRDDKAPVFLSKAPKATAEGEPFRLADGSECSWLKKDETLGPSKLRPRIEPWLTALFQSEHLSLLVGSGLSHAVHRIATGEALPGMKPVTFTHFNADINIEAGKSAAVTGRETGNIEDQIRVANELLRGIEIIEGSSEELKVKATGLKKRDAEYFAHKETEHGTIV